MRKKRISTVFIALVVAVGIPASAFAADMDVAKGTIGEGTVVTTQVNGQAISSTGSNESVKPDTTTREQSGSSENESAIETGNSAEQNKDGAEGESGNLPVAEEPVVEEPAVQEPEVEEPAIEEPKAEEPKAEEPKVEEPAVEEPTATDPAIVVEPVVTEPAIVIEEPVVTEPAIVVEPVITDAAIVVTEPAIIVEPVAATLTIVQRMNIGEQQIDSERIIDNLVVGQGLDLKQYIVVQKEIEFVGSITNITISKDKETIVLEYKLKDKSEANEEL